MAVGVSGGRDSLALVELLCAVNRGLERPLDLIGVHVALNGEGRSGALPRAHADFLARRGVGLVEVDLPEEGDLAGSAGCFQCARVRRRALLTAARDLDCRLLALGHHADDAVETWLVSMLYTGTPEVLVPRRSYFGGEVTLVRPAWSLRRGELARLHRLSGAPQPVPPCPREAESRRARVFAMLRMLGRDERRVRRQLFWAVARELGRETVEGECGPHRVDGRDTA